MAQQPKWPVHADAAARAAAGPTSRGGPGAGNRPAQRAGERGQRPRRERPSGKAAQADGCTHGSWRDRAKYAGRGPTASPRGQDLERMHNHAKRTLCFFLFDPR